VEDAGPFCYDAALRRAPLMITGDLVRVCSLTDRDRANVLAEELRRAGITAVFLPSAWAIGMWDVEVPADDVGLARAIVEGVGRH
jgi:hypothetical protein